MLFGGGGGGGRRGPSGPRKTDDLEHPLRVSLEDLYLGKDMKVAVTRTSFEKDPSGSVMDRAGNRYNKKQERVVLDVTVDRGMAHGQRITFPGKGDQMPGAFRRSTRHAGRDHRQRLPRTRGPLPPLPSPGALQGDIVLVIQQKEHDVFQRRGSDLIIKKEITLLEALTGPKFIVEHLDGHKVCGGRSLCSV